MCHVSDRSYPFLLASDMGVSRGADMQSIACSGAVRHDVLSVGSTTLTNSDYMGQDEPRFGSEGSGSAPRLRGLPGAQQLKDQALSDFIPGRVQQVEMVRQYQPKVATIGISGNDMGFGPILSECITNLPLSEDCSYAKPDGLARLGKLINENYTDQLNFYNELKKASPGTDFYAVGYPQFIRDDTAYCAEVAGSLTQNERSMIRHSVSALNETIRNAAATAGIKYIDIENVITDSTQDMCGQSGMITGATDKLFYGGITQMYRDFQAAPTKENESAIEYYILSTAWADAYSTVKTAKYGPIQMINLLLQEAFHPNAEGHNAIYDYIHANQNGTSLLDDTCDRKVIVCPADANMHQPVTPEYFGPSDREEKFAKLLVTDSTTGVQYIQMSGQSIVERGTIQDIVLHQAAYQPGSLVSIEIHSDPVQLGTATVSEDGTITATVTIPKTTPVGYHKLTLEGTTASGAAMEYFEPLFVVGPEDDIDGDGVLNAVDSCDFLVPSGVDSDGDGLDNACDLVNGIGSAIKLPPQLLNSDGMIDSSVEGVVTANSIGAILGQPKGLAVPAITESKVDNRSESYARFYWYIGALILLVSMGIAYTLLKRRNGWK
jgi:lysophospholipase L1-like esterase